MSGVNASGNAPSCQHEVLPNFFNSTAEDALWQWAAALWTGLFASALSLAGSLFILVSYCAFQRFRNPNYRVFVSIAFCDAFVAVAHLSVTGGMRGTLFQTNSTELRDTSNSGGASPSNGSQTATWSGDSVSATTCASTFCYVTAVVQQYFHLAEYLWISVLALTIYLTLVHAFRVTKQFERALHAAVWGLSAVISIVPAATNCYGSSGHWCWVKNDEMCSEVQWGVLFGWLFLLYLFNIFCYGSAEIALCHNPGMKKIAGRLRLYVRLPSVVPSWLHRHHTHTKTTTSPPH